MPVWQHGDREIGLLMFGCPCISALKTSTIFLHCLASCCFADIGIGGPLFISAPARLGTNLHRFFSEKCWSPGLQSLKP